MKPLEEWICDTCHDIIPSAKEGWFEWLEDNNGIHSFRIVHNREQCHQHASNIKRKDMHLHEFVEQENLPSLYAFLDPGYMKNPKNQRIPNNVNLGEFTEILRRLTIPHYDEARQYFGNADSDGLFDGANEVSPYVQSKLKEIIKRYAP